MNRLTRHHTLWTRREYQKTTVPNLLREHQAMVIPIPREDHDQLHMEISPLPVMTTNLARVALGHLHDLSGWQGSPRPRLEMFDGLTEKLYAEARGMGRVAVEAGMFAEHFEDQRVHLERAYLI
jgi:DNA repair exonuclease SbcCD nuclease subunit